MRQFFNFDQLITPKFIQIIFIIALLCSISYGLIDIILYHHWLTGLIIIIGGPIGARLICEVAIVLFQINKNLDHIHQALKQSSHLQDDTHDNKQNT